METVIEVKNLHREYVTYKGAIRKKKEVVEAVRGIDFTVNRGEIFGLLGQNGAGKTTTIKMLTTLLAPTSGMCKVFGYDTFGQEKQIRKRLLPIRKHREERENGIASAVPFSHFSIDAVTFDISKAPMPL